MYCIRIVIEVFPFFLVFLNLTNKDRQVFHHLPPFLLDIVWVLNAPPRKQRAPLVLYECQIVVLALVVAFDTFKTQLLPVNDDVVPFNKNLDLLLILAHHVVLLRQDAFPMLSMIFQDFFNDSLVLRVEGLQKHLSLRFPLHEAFCLVHQIDVEHVEIVEVVQVKVQYDMEVLLNFLPREAVYVVVTIHEASHILEKILFYLTQLRDVG